MVPNLYADITARYARLSQSLEKGASLRDAARYVWPHVAKDGSMSGSLGIATREGIANRKTDIDYDRKRIRFVISTQNPDRSSDVVISRGIQVHNYRGNPQFSFGHWTWDISPAKMTDPDGNLCFYPEDRRVLADAWFDPKDSDAMLLFQKYADGFMNATSIAFLPIDAHRIEKSHGWQFDLIDLTEVALCNTPDNPEALRDFLDAEKSFMTPKLYKAWGQSAARPRGKCFTGYCPCPPCEEDMSKNLNAATLTNGLKSGLPKKKGKCKCGGKCQTCKGVPEQDTGAEAANNPEGEHEHEEHEANQLHEAVAAKLPMLKKAGYDDAQSGAIAHHLAGKGVEGIEGHEEVARALGYKKDEMSGDSGTGGGDSVEMGLKEFLGSIRKSADDDKPEEKPEEKPAEASGAEEGEESGPEFKESAMVLGGMHNHMKNAHEFLTDTLKTLDHPQIAKAMTHHLKDLSGHMESYKELHDKFHPDNNFEKMCKSMMEGSGEREAVSEETGSDADREATTEKPHEDTAAGDKSGTDLIREDYSTPKGAKGQKRKSMGDSTCLTEAAKCMKEVAGDPRTCSMHKGALMHHAGNVEAYCNKAEEPMADAGGSQASPEEMELQKRLMGSLSRISQKMFEGTGDPEFVQNVV